MGLLFTSAFISVYFTFRLFNNLFFLVLLFLFFRSNKDYLWFAFVFVIMQAPGGIFASGDLAQSHRIPIFPILPGISLTFFDLFFILALIKAFRKKRREHLFLRKPFNNLLIYGVFLLIFSLIIGINQQTYFNILRTAFLYTIFFSFPVLVYREEHVFRLVHLILPFVFLIFGIQLYEFVHGGQRFMTKFTSGVSGRIHHYEGETRVIVRGIWIHLISYIFSFFYLAKRNYKGNRLFLFSVVAVVMLSIIVSATRGAIVQYASIAVLYFFFVEKINIRTAGYFFIGFFIFLFLVNTMPYLRDALGVGVSRFETVKLLAEGDITAGGTVDRFNVRLPKVLEGIYRSPIIGWGFSKVFKKYQDMHVGNFSLLLQVGIVGFTFFLYLWFYFINSAYKIHKSLPKYAEYKKSILVPAVGLIGMLVLHFSSGQLFGYIVLYAPLNFSIILFFLLTDFFLKNNYLEAKRLKNVV